MFLIDFWLGMGLGRGCVRGVGRWGPYAVVVLDGLGHERIDEKR